MEFDQALYDEFVAEATEHLLTIEDDFLALERQADAPDPELVDKLFRAIHSVKGGSAFLGLNKIRDLAHVMENLLAMMRGGEICPEPRYIESLLRGVDLLSGMIGDYRNSNATDIEAVRSRLAALAAGEAVAARAAPAPEPPRPPKASAAATPPLSPESSNTAGLEIPPGLDTDLDLAAVGLAALKSRFDYLYLLTYRLDQATGLSPAALMADLLASGEVVDARMSVPGADLAAGLPTEPLRFDILYATLIDPDMIALVAGLEEEQAVLVSELTRIQTASPVASPAPASEEHATLPDAVLSGADRDVAALAAMPESAPVRSPARAAAPKAQPVPLAPQAPQPKDETKTGATGTVRININILDKLMTLAGELVLVRNQQLLSAETAESGFRDIVQRLDIVTTELQGTIMSTRMQPIGNVFGKLPRIVRDLSGSLGKEIEISLEGREVELDKTILESLTDPLTHIIRNCCDHGIETPEARERAGKPPVGQIRVRAYHEGGQINIVIEDDGRGIDPAKVRGRALERGVRSEQELAQMSDKELLSLVMLPGFSTADKVSAVSGRGVGMDVVKHGIEDLGGSLELESWPGLGTSLHLRLPLTLAIIPCLITMINGQRFAIPQVNLKELVCLYDRDVITRIEVAGSQEVYRLRDRLLPMVRLGEVLSRPEPFTREVKGEIVEKYRRQRARFLTVDGQVRPDAPPDPAGTLNFAVVKVGASSFGIIVDRVLGTEEIVVKPMHPALKHLKIYSGATVMGDGAVALILDIEGLARHAGVSMVGRGEDSPARTGVTSSGHDIQSILLFRSGPKEQFALALPLIRRIERISMSRVEKVGPKEFITIEGVSTLVVRLDRYLDVSPVEDQEEMFLILPKFINRPFGILMSSILDIEETPIGLNTTSYLEDGLLGTDIIRDHLTMFPDIYRIIEKAEPHWFHERRLLAPPPGESRRILVVEDSAFLRQMVTKYLESDNYEVEAAENGRQALELLEDGGFDLIVSDIDMPVMNGLEFIKNVRHSGGRRDIPAIALTSLSSEADRLRALEAGFDLYQIKIDRERFLAEVATLLNSSGHARPGALRMEAVHAR